MLQRMLVVSWVAFWLDWDAASSVAAAPPPSYSMTVEAFHVAVTADEPAAKQKYGGKTIELVGTIASMNVYSDAVAYVMLDGGKAGCFVDDPQPWDRFGNGQKVRVRGTFTRRIVGVGLERCTMTAIDESPLIKRSAAEISAEFKKDMDAAGDKYNDRQFLVTGKITKIDRDESGSARIYFQGVGGATVSCTFSYDLEKRLRTLKVGQEFACSGVFLRILGTKNDVGLISGLPIKVPVRTTKNNEE